MREKTVKDTGAKAGDILIGGKEKWHVNHHMRLRVHRSLKSGKGGRIATPITLLCSGDGDYAEQLRPYVRKRFETTKELHDIICKAVSKADGKPTKWIHIFNANALEKESS